VPERQSEYRRTQIDESHGSLDGHRRLHIALVARDGMKADLRPTKRMSFAGGEVGPKQE